MGKITKKKIEKHLKKGHSRKFKKCLRGLVAEAVDEQIGNGEADEIEIKDISLEIISAPEGSMEPCVMFKGKKSKVKKSKSKGKSKVKATAFRRCVYYCYVRGGTRICRELFCYQ